MVLRFTSTDLSPQDRESEPRFVGGPPRGDFGPGARGGFGGGFGGPPGAGGVRQIYVSNVCPLFLTPRYAKFWQALLTVRCSFLSTLAGKT